MSGNLRDMAQYADIDLINAPETAEPGSDVTIEVDVYNIGSVVCSIELLGTVFVDIPGVGFTLWGAANFQPPYANPDPGTGFRFTAFITMPPYKTTIYLTSAWYGSDGNWHPDDGATIVINLPSAVEGFSDFKIAAVSKV